MKLFPALVLAFVLIQSPEAQITRLSPAVFPELPANLVQELQRRGCTVPQETYSKGRNNVIKGEFAKPGQADWAVLCSVKGISTILVFWNGSESNPASLVPVEDKFFAQSYGRGQFGYVRGIIDHQGVGDVFIEKASVVWYFYQGQWLKLTGGD